MYDQMPFTGNSLNRVSDLHQDKDWVASQLASAESRFLPLRKLNPLAVEASSPALLWLDADARARLDPDQPPVLLGTQDGVAHFAVDLGDAEIDDVLVAQLGVESPEFPEARSIATGLSAAEAGILAQARSLIDWHRRHRFCSSCGAATEPDRGGAIRRCPACQAQHFPRTDPVVIMVVWKGDQCLLGRRKGRVGGMFSAFAGFIDQGETIEAAVRREVQEEAGLVVDEVVYRASQPWPFPSSLMIGCFARATSHDFQIDDDEIGEARWFSRDELLQALDSPGPELAVPGPVAIAHHLIRDWCATGPSGPGSTSAAAPQGATPRAPQRRKAQLHERRGAIGGTQCGRLG